MATNNDVFSLPEGPKGLCFNKNEFMKKTFSVDEFLQENRNAASLETMRDDLGIYLKVLRSAMIELINKDYADFVNLSANLVGLDVAISSIQTPLGQLKEEILLVKLTLTDVMTELKECLEQRTYLRNQKRSLQNLLKIRNSISKLDTLLMQIDSDSNLNPALLERVAAELNQLEFCMAHCDHIQSIHKDSRDRIHIRVCDEIDNLFRDSIKTKNTDLLVRALQIYITLDKVNTAENLFRKEIIAPALDKIISENNLQSKSDGLAGIYKQILTFIDSNMSQILSITQPKDSEALVRGCDFILNSLWPEIEMRLENHMSSIFAPGNPDMFYEKYYETNAFLLKLEDLFNDSKSVIHFRQHSQYKSFQQRWNLPVYFQIRFQEIGGSMETVCSENLSKVDNAKNNLRLLQTATTWECILRCWAKGVFLEQIAHRFWKLSLQLISRFHTWTTEAISEVIKSETDSINKIELLVILYMDIVSLTAKIPEIYDIAKNLLTNLTESNQTLLKSTLDESKSSLLTSLPNISNEIIKLISTQSMSHIKHVNDIPRLFRKTNRGTPTKPCPYIKQILELPLNFHSRYKKEISSDITTWLETIFSNITEKLHSSVSDVLTSVQKTEESLRRLKQIRDRATATNTSEKSGVSDDDKIRLQLLVDTSSYCSSIKQIGLEFSQIKMLQELIKLVEGATKVKIGQIK